MDCLAASGGDDSMRAEIEKAEASGTKRPIEKFVLAALSNSDKDLIGKYYPELLK